MRGTEKTTRDSDAVDLNPDELTREERLEFQERKRWRVLDEGKVVMAKNGNDISFFLQFKKTICGETKQE